MLQSTFSKAALCAAGGAVAAMTAVGPASAVAAAPALPDGGGKVHKGWTTDKTDVHKRPSYDSKVISYVEKHRHIYLKCMVRKPGDDVWYKLATQRGWVNSDTVRTRSHVPHCSYGWGMNDSSMNDSSMNDASTYPVDQRVGEMLG